MTKPSVSPMGACLWPISGTDLFVFWNGPGARLWLTSNKTGGIHTSIETPGACAIYDSQADAQEAVERFLATRT